MRPRRAALAVLSLALASSWATAAAVAGEATPAAQPDTASAPPIGVISPDQSDAAPLFWLRGPFGKVAGGTLAEPAAAPPHGMPLDTFSRRAPLLLEVDDPALLLGTRVAARLVGSAAHEELLSRGTPAFEGPATSGRQLIVASLVDGDDEIERAWLVDVPDRDPPDDGLYDIPAPQIVVVTSSGARSGVIGDGCYAYLCVETGEPPPAGELEPLRAIMGETPELRIGDGSALVAWEGRLTPLGDTPGDAHEARGVITDTPTATVSLSGLGPTARGDWLLEVEVEFDRERGWLRTAYRLAVE